MKRDGILPFDLNKNKNKKQRGVRAVFGWRDKERWERERNGSGEMER